ncbi:MAG: Imm8 family immunity protein [Actinomycetota bacterium]
MRAQIRGIHSPDVDDPATWTPEQPGWCLFVQLFVGPEDGPGEESFGVVVCDPSWIGQQVEDGSVLDGRHTLVIDEFDWASLETYFQQRVGSYEENSWVDLAAKLSRLGRWEFEDYQP